MSEENGNGPDPAAWTPAVEELLKNWHGRVYAAQTAYYEVAERFRRRNYQMGIPVVKFGENATLHGAAADWFSAIRRDIEEILALPPESRGKAKACLGRHPVGDEQGGAEVARVE